jgi:hypothetical protein
VEPPLEPPAGQRGSERRVELSRCCHQSLGTAHIPRAPGRKRSLQLHGGSLHLGGVAVNASTAVRHSSISGAEDNAENDGEQTYRQCRCTTAAGDTAND